ncbi:MAG TPA: enoyl-CoA hydratase-related protein [Thermoplasmata archaeon]|nr:enoyl-CoA hydratase-related protein [Thermoplasmata archaeon]
MAYETILVEKKDHIAKITFNRPDKLNALNAKCKDEVVSALEALAGDEDVRVVVFTGAGEKAFVAGADIQEFAGRTAVQQWEITHGGHIYEAVAEFPKPIIAMINGYCLGGGCELAMAMDIRIASERAKLGQPEVNIGIIPGGGGSQRLPRLVGEGKAMELILTGDMIDAAEAHRIGLVDEVVPHAELEKRTREIAAKIAAKSPVSIRMAKLAVKAASRLPLEQGLAYEASLFGLVFTTEDKEEGVKAFLEKRAPQWKGR